MLSEIVAAVPRWKWLVEARRTKDLLKLADFWQKLADFWNFRKNLSETCFRQLRNQKVRWEIYLRKKSVARGAIIHFCWNAHKHDWTHKLPFVPVIWRRRQNLEEEWIFWN